MANETPKATEYFLKTNLHYKVKGLDNGVTTVMAKGEQIPASSTTEQIADWLKRGLIESKDEISKRNAEVEKEKKETEKKLKR